MNTNPAVLRCGPANVPVWVRNMRRLLLFTALACATTLPAAAAATDDSYGRVCVVPLPQVNTTAGEDVFAGFATAIEAKGCARGDVVVLHGEFGFSQTVAAQFCDFTQQVLAFGHTRPVTGGAMVTCVYAGGRRRAR